MLLTNVNVCASILYILLTKTTAAQNEVALSYYSVRGLSFLAVAFAATLICQQLKVISTFV